MADKKFSELDAAPSSPNAMIVCCVVAGDSYKITKANMLIAASGETIAVIGSGSTNNMSLFASGSAQLIATGSGELAVASANGSMNIDSNGNIEFDVGSAAVFTVNGNGGLLQVGPTGGITLTPNAGNFVNIGFEPGDSSKWATDPTQYAEAINRIAALLVSLNGGTPIP